ncbi:hypothetical protein BC937DRAFT_88582 [Endogone sp. FLAS-F59071]|nr:hypothetical protein BC937DRAFT_88582 [Endogone sp. FLAS-F59071]|eukprot:RUS18599.1 hypothetical protein BC937DRAFT_88582 [Endogone sp. FLAS-F59071]
MKRSYTNTEDDTSKEDKENVRQTISKMPSDNQRVLKMKKNNEQNIANIPIETSTTKSEISSTNSSIMTMMIPTNATTMTATTATITTILQNHRGANRSSVITMCSIYKDELLDFGGLCIGSILLTYWTKYPKDLSIEVTKMDRRLSSGKLKIQDAPLWDFSLLIKVALRLMKHPFTLNSEITRRSMPIFLAYRLLRNTFCHREFIQDHFWGTALFCTKKLANIAYDYNSQISVPIFTGEEDTYVLLKDILDIIEERQNNIYFEMLQRIKDRNIVPIDVKSRIIELYQEMFSILLEEFKTQINEIEYSRKMDRMKRDHSIDSNFKTWNPNHQAIFLLELWPKFNKADDILKIESTSKLYIMDSVKQSLQQIEESVIAMIRMM